MDSVKFCLKHPSQKMTLLLFSHVCDLCDPPKKSDVPELVPGDGTLMIGDPEMKSSGRVFAGGFRPGQRVYLWCKTTALRGANGVVRDDSVTYPEGVPCIFDPPASGNKCTETVSDLRLAVDGQGYVLCPECNDGSRAVKALMAGKDYNECWAPECEKGHRWKHTWKDGDCTNNRKTSASKMYDYRWNAVLKDWSKI